MTYQEFTASTEQTLKYLSDSIFSVYDSYNTDNIKLFKHAYWIFLYKQNSRDILLFDVRNNSWWPMTMLKNVTKIVNKNDKPYFLLERDVFVASTAEAEYSDVDRDDSYQIDWNLKSQKLHLNATNYYKHIVNITFNSVHDKDALTKSYSNVDDLDFKLQVNNYRKRLDGNIGKDDYLTVNYKVETIRTYVQRLNYSKVNEFQYLLSSNEENAINIPLSLSSITVKYKISNQVR
jgi:hypothetical protein